MRGLAARESRARAKHEGVRHRDRATFWWWVELDALDDAGHTTGHLSASQGVHRGGGPTDVAVLLDGELDLQFALQRWVTVELVLVARSDCRQMSSHRLLQSLGVEDRWCGRSVQGPQRGVDPRVSDDPYIHREAAFV